MNSHLLKFTVSFVLVVFLLGAVYPQAPGMFNYQAVVRNNNGQPIANEQIQLEIAIIKSQPDGEIVFAETHVVETNDFGLVNLMVGSVESLTGIAWGDDEYFIRLSLDNVVMGVSQLLSVPYALHAGTAADSFSGDYNDLQNTPDLSSFIQLENPQNGDMLIYLQNQWNVIPSGEDGQVLTIINGFPAWTHLNDNGNGGGNGDDPTTVTDIDGNIYKTVILGTQEWMAENLKTTRFNNGTQIAYPGDNIAEWINNSSGAYAWFNNDEETYKDIYGALYNFPAVNTGALCPLGWRVPDLEDWSTLVTYITSQEDEITSANIGNYLKSCRQVDSPLGDDCDTNVHPRWNAHETHYGRDLFGFAAIPGGNRIAGGSFDRLGETGYFWTSVPAVTDRAHQRYIHSNNEGLYSSHTWEANGNSVRCMRDFDPDGTAEYTLTLTTQPLDAGVVQGGGTYTEGYQVNISAVANESFEFVSWITDTGILVSEQPDFVYTMPPVDITLMAVFSGDGDQFGTVEDIDGNEYLTLTIGTQIWMAENLKTTQYNDGTAINFHGTDLEAWQNTTSGAYAWYNNNIANKEIYGALYNWYAASSGNLCPTGWHVPAEADWVLLVNFLINNNQHLNTDNVGNALKSCRQVDSPLGGDCDTNVHPRWDSHFTHYGTNEFGFNGLPGGRLSTSGVYDFMGLLGYFWTSEQQNSTEGKYRSLSRANGRLSSLSQEKNFGFSIRCVRNAAD